MPSYADPARAPCFAITGPAKASLVIWYLTDQCSYTYCCGEMIRLLIGMYPESQLDGIPTAQLT